RMRRRYSIARANRQTVERRAMRTLRDLRISTGPNHMIVEAALLAGSVVFTGSLWFAKKMVERADRLDEKKATAKTEIENCPAWDARGPTKRCAPRSKR